MHFSLFTPLFLLMALSVSAQHPWSVTLNNAADDFVFTLRVAESDSVCFVGRPERADGVADSSIQAIQSYFAHKLRERAKGAEIIENCTEETGTIRLTTELTDAGEGRIRMAPTAIRTSNEKKWSAVFFLKAVDELPTFGRNEDFNPEHFTIPSLPTKVKVLRMSGDVIDGRLLSVEGTEITLEVEKTTLSGKPKKDKFKEVSIHKSEVFSITFNTGEWVLYAPDEMLGDDLLVDQMRIYIAGEQDARDLYNPLPTVLVGVVVGAGAAILASGGLILTILPPLAYAAAQFIPIMKIEEKTIRNPAHRFNEDYAAGYERVARSRKVLGGLKGSALGMVAGVAVYYLVLR